MAKTTGNKPQSEKAKQAVKALVAAKAAKQAVEPQAPAVVETSTEPTPSIELELPPTDQDNLDALMEAHPEAQEATEEQLVAEPTPEPQPTPQVDLQALVADLTALVAQQAAAKTAKEKKPAKAAKQSFIGVQNRPQVGVQPRLDFPLLRADLLGALKEAGIPHGAPGVLFVNMGDTPENRQYHVQSQVWLNLDKLPLTVEEALAFGKGNAWQETANIVIIPVYWYTRAAYPGGPKPTFVQTSKIGPLAYCQREQAVQS